MQNLINKVKKGHKAVVPYITLGYPSIDSDIELIKKFSEAGADAVELGIPYSDPLADGPTIQYSSQTSLDRGFKLVQVFDLLDTIKDINIVKIIFSYYAPIYAYGYQYGMEYFIRKVAEKGVTGIIIPDLPIEELAKMREICDKYNVSLIPLIAPTTTPSRLKIIAENITSFAYLVSVAGVTGARKGFSDTLKDKIEECSAQCSAPIFVGFGIGSASQAKQVIQMGADGVIVGSAVIKAIRDNNEDIAQAIELIKEIRETIDKE